ncbi:T9SS C-terminal target domain-containing protein [Paracrocinitomix mangrovi]|uniref:T9SS C-terminal target domain-containing protein n=1 Tax=Paracrocinitomix mangrovi TaxID=2862509 RepID=UPI001C8DC7F2|nr:T9SS C-terminal target domain-containing protein [Paracrocinitomix mangrovi]UKN03564.1 T9SS C-terminal target domain-containing protein [Paracrocinitomix mangrovi]
MRLSITLITLSFCFTSWSYRNFDHHRPGNNDGDAGSRAAGCAPANERLYMEFNNVKAIIETGGLLWQERSTGTASYEVPKGSNKYVIYSGALWMGGEDVNGQLKIAAQMFGQGRDFWTGPLGSLDLNSGNYDPSIVQNAETTLYRDHGSTDIKSSQCLKYDQFYTIRKAEVLQFIAWWECENLNLDPSECEGVEKPSDEVMDRIINWPAHGDMSLKEDYYLAPFYDNVEYENNTPGVYDPINDGDYPWYDIEGKIDCRADRRVTLYGDETHWWVFNDRGNIHTETGGASIGMEIRAQAFSFATDDAINDMTFYNYELINRGSYRLTNTYFGQWVDTDIGDYSNDYVGCDVSRGLGYAYNGESVDNGNSGQDPYGASPPAIGIDFFEGPYKDNDGIDNPLTTNIAEAIAQGGIPYEGLGIGYGDGTVDNERLGMSKFVYFTGGAGAVQGDPDDATDYYQYLKGLWLNNDPFTFGGNGASGSIPTNYCFPGESDPYNWGTLGVPTGQSNWSEVTEGNPPGDRRFLQSAGPFTLEPGAVNNITVGVVYGRNTQETDLEASVRTMKEADSKAQALFDNCFELVEPPRAPTLTIQEMENELILFLQPGEDEQNWFSEDVIYIQTPDSLKDQGIFYDDTFRFEGYQIFQMIGPEASVSDIDDIQKARLVAQCDVENGVSKLVNYEYNEQLGITIPQVMVDGEDAGIRHSFHITEDQFATGARNLVNHKKYYFLAVAYAHNNFMNYVPTEPDSLFGQKKPYLRSRLSATGGGIESVTGIPHDPTPEADGTLFTTSYGYQPAIVQIEGIGNGGTFTDLDSLYRDNNVLNWSSPNVHPKYKPGSGPVDIKVIDPLNLAGGNYTLKFGTVNTDINDEEWSLTREYEDENGQIQIDTFNSKFSVGVKNEELILDWGISVTINQQFYQGNGNCTYKYTSPIDATMTYQDSSKAWLGGVSDDDQFYPTNWIRSGSTSELGDTLPACDPTTWIYNECKYNDYPLDVDQEYEKLLDGIVAPFNRVGTGVYGMPFGFPGDDPSTFKPLESWFSSLGTVSLTKSCFPVLHDVDIVFTSNKDYWTRCPVIEINDNEAQTEHGDDILHMRRDSSVDKFGKPDGTGTGMGWFPGYAVDVNTGKRLNMCFAENSWLGGENGNDMIWNPTSRFADQTGNPLFGGMHYIYVFGENVDGSECPSYDEGAWLADKFDLNHPPADWANNFYKAWKSCFWVMEPMLIQNATLLETDVEIKLRINKPYEDRLVNGENTGRPMYQFSIDNPTEKIKDDRLLSVLDNINVVPNPYYGYSEYETSKIDNRVKITNLPERCTVTIFNMQGALIRSFEKDDPITSLDWNLKNHAGVPIAGGLYLIHVKLPITADNGDVSYEERILKWYGALRTPDLDNL